MSKLFPEDGGRQEAREGTAAHHYLSEFVGGNVAAIGSLAPNGHPITEEMVDGALDLIVDYMSLRDAGVELVVEQRVTMPAIHPLNWGTTDIGGVDRRNRVVYVRDYKFGHGYVDAFEAWQLIDYAVGICELFQITDIPNWTFDFAISQPRNYAPEGPWRPWRISGEEFMRYASRLADAADAAAQPDAPLKTGPYCKHCSAAHACPALITAGGFAMDVATRGVPTIMSAEAKGIFLAMVRDAAERLKALETGLTAQVEADLRQGQRVPGWMTKQEAGPLEWVVPIEDVLNLGVAAGIDLAKPTKALTPLQAMKKGIDEPAILAYAKRVKTKTVLAAVSDKSARKVFSGGN